MDLHTFPKTSEPEVAELQNNWWKTLDNVKFVFQQIASYALYDGKRSEILNQEGASLHNLSAILLLWAYMDFDTEVCKTNSQYFNMLLQGSLKYAEI